MKINIGAGQHILEGYINIDRKTGGEMYPLMDKGIVFDSCVADEIRASHCLEHVSHRETMNVLREWVRVLKPGGLLKIAVPDFDVACSLRKDDPKWRYYLTGGHVDNDDVHGAIFTRDETIALLKEAGCNFDWETGFWKSEVKDCASLPVSLNLQATKREDVQDAPKPELSKPRKILAIMSAPRAGFTLTHGLIETILSKYGIQCNVYQGAFWEQGIQNLLEKAIASGFDDALAIDFDSVFDHKQFERMLTHWLNHPEVDALAPLQPQRGTGLAMLTPVGCALSSDTHVAHVTAKEHSQDGMQVRTAHFGLTFIRLKKLESMRKPWFWNQPAAMELPTEICDEFDRFVAPHQVNKFISLFEKHFGLRFTLDKNPDSGRWKTNGSIDADIYFWKKWEAAGNNLFVLTDVLLGHQEVLIAQHNHKTGYASYRHATDWLENPYSGKSADVPKNDEGIVSSPLDDYEINASNYFDDAALFLSDKYPQTFIQDSKVCLGQPSTDLSGCKYRNIDTKAHIKIHNGGKRRIHITFSGARYEKTVKCIIDNSPKLGADKVYVYDDKWLIENHPEFIRDRANIFYDTTSKNGTYTRGFGWFCWKPFIIQHALENFCEDGDIVLFTDADTYPVQDLTPFYDYADEHGVMLFGAAHLRQRHWCKRDTMAAMGMDADRWRDMQAGNARYMLFKKTDKPIGYENDTATTVSSFLNQWLSLASQKQLTTFELSDDEYPELIKTPNGKALGQHRCEQAILTNLANWYGIPLHRPPCQDGNGYIK